MTHGLVISPEIRNTLLSTSFLWVIESNPSLSQLLLYLRIDDVVDASPVHFFCGMWGTLAAGLFAEPDNVQMAYGTGSCGLFYKVGL